MQQAVQRFLQKSVRLSPLITNSSRHGLPSLSKVPSVEAMLQPAGFYTPHDPRPQDFESLTL